MDLDGQVAVVTGAARGIGRAIARRLAGAGAVVVCADCVDPGETVSAINEDGKVAAALTLDVTDPEAAAQAVADILGQHGRLHILVNNAGITSDKLFVRMRPDDWRKVLSVNLDGIYNLTQPVAKIMMRKRYGRIVSISSVVGLMGNPGQCNYSASKAGLIGLTKSLARELGRRNVTVNAVAPGYIQTPMTDQLTDSQREALLANLAIPRLGSPEDVADAVAFLVGPGAEYITGTVINVSGGLYM